MGRMNRLFKGLEVIRGTLDNPEEEGFFQFEQGRVTAKAGREMAEAERQKMENLGWFTFNENGQVLNVSSPESVLWAMYD